MDPLQVKRLKEEYLKGLNFSEEKIKKWENFKEDYEALKQRLETLPDQLSYDITVPLGDNAFTKGKLVHTNEIMVLLGDNWFAEVSAKQAVGIATRRISQCKKMLEDLDKEKQQFQNWLDYVEKISENEDLVEIVEDYDEEREKAWKEQHAQNVKSYRKQLVERKKKGANENVSDNESDEDYLRKLEKLQLAESNGVNDSEDDTSKSEIDSKEIKSAESAGTSEYSDEASHSEEHPERPVLKLNLNNRLRKASESETGDDCEDSYKRDWNSYMQEGTSPKNGKHVRWVDLSKQNIKKITFKHSKPKKPSTPSSKYKAIDSNEDENHPLIQSPSDIYKLFGNCLQSSPPKSILKVKTPSPSTDMNGPFFPTKDILCKESSPETDESVNSPFTGEVRECSAPINIVQNNKSSRPTSHFKSSRKNRKR